MTTARFLRAALRRWYLVLLGLALTAWGANFLYTAPATTYWSQTTVTILQPRANPLATEGFELADLSSALVLRINGAPASSKTSSPETTLYGEGVRQGTRIRVRDVGRQWATSIPDPVVLVEAVGPDPAWVASQMDAQLDAVWANLDELQTELNISEANRVFMRASPETPTVTAITGSRVRAAGATAVLGIAATGIVIYFIDRRWPAPHRNPAPHKNPASDKRPAGKKSNEEQACQAS